MSPEVQCFVCGASVRLPFVVCPDCLTASDRHMAISIKAELARRADPERTRRAVVGQ